MPGHGAILNPQGSGLLEKLEPLLAGYLTGGQVLWWGIGKVLGRFSRPRCLSAG